MIIQFEGEIRVQSIVDHKLRLDVRLEQQEATAVVSFMNSDHQQLVGVATRNRHRQPAVFVVQE